MEGDRTPVPFLAGTKKFGHLTMDQQQTIMDIYIYKLPAFFLAFF
jgi:hypothetical protein